MDKGLIVVIFIIVLCIAGIVLQIYDTYKHYQQKYNRDKSRGEKSVQYKVALQQKVDHYTERVKEVLEGYYRRNTEGNEDPLEICVLREGKHLVDTLNEENQRHLDMVNVFLGLRDVYVNIDGEWVQWEPTEELEARGFNLQ